MARFLTADGELTYTRGEPALRAGDIVSVPAGETMSPTLTQRTVRLLREIERKGLRVGRLEDHL